MGQQKWGRDWKLQVSSCELLNHQHQNSLSSMQKSRQKPASENSSSGVQFHTYILYIRTESYNIIYIYTYACIHIIIIVIIIFDIVIIIVIIYIYTYVWRYCRYNPSYIMLRVAKKTTHGANGANDSSMKVIPVLHHDVFSILWTVFPWQFPW